MHREALMLSNKPWKVKHPYATILKALMRKIPATMVSQHPDHAGKPYWLDREYISTDLEWDWERKFVDEAVIERLFGQHYSYFSKLNLGKDKF